MKRIFSISFAVGVFISVSYTGYAQDVIVKKDASSILAKVQSISETDVEYKRWDNLEGPTYKISKSSIMSITYQNGATDTFDSFTNQNTLALQNSKRIHVEGANFVYDYNGKPLTNKEVFANVCQGADYDFYKNLNPSMVNLSYPIAMTVVGGLTLPLSVWALYDVLFVDRERSVMGEIGQGILVGIGPILTAVGIGGIVSVSKNRNRLNSIADRYNSSFYSSMDASVADWELSFGVTNTGGIGLKFSF